MDDVKAAITQHLINWRDQLLAIHYPNCGFSITAPVLLSDSNINVLADCATPIRTMDDLNGRIRWTFSSVYGQALLEELDSIYSTLDFTTAVKPLPPKKSKPSLAAELLASTANPSATNEVLASADQPTPPTINSQGSKPARGRGSVSRGRGRGRGRGTGCGRGRGTGRGRGKGSVQGK